MTDTKNVLWLDSVFQMGDVELNKFIECLMQLRAYMVDHGTPEGFSYRVTPSANWWDGKTKFKAYAREGCKVWKIGINDAVHVGIADTLTPWATEKAGFPMDVAQIVTTPNAPTWFIVAKDSTSKWVCLASETTEKV
jgi:hypothetical protein